MKFRKLFNWLLGDKDLFEIVINPCYGGDFSVKHLGGWLYINPQFDGLIDQGPGISYNRCMCGSLGSVDGAKRMIDEWTRVKYGKMISEVTVIVRES